MPVSDHPIDSINLKDPRLGDLSSSSRTSSTRTGVGKGRLRIALDPAERHSALTVNEYETLLMKYDLAEVLRNPLRFVAEQYRHALANPRAVPAKTLGYAKYDFVRVLNTGPRHARPARIDRREGARAHAGRSGRALLPHAPIGQPARVGMRRRRRRIVEGTYQSPILVQWQNAPRQSRDARRHAHRTPLAFAIR